MTDALFKDARIALRFGSGQVLIVGGEIRGPYNRYGSLDDSSIDKSPQPTVYASMLPGELIYLVQPQDMTRFQFKPETKWRIGDRWKVYPGAGPAVTVVIRRLAVILVCGGIGGYGAAIAGFESPNVADSIDGLRASLYIAAPGQGLAGVSSTPLMPVDVWREAELTGGLGRLLFSQARGIVRNENWMIQPRTEKTLADRIRQMNRLFLAGSQPQPEIRYSRWSPSGRKPLLFVEALWIDKSSLPLFACDAVVEEGKELTILSFRTTQAEDMRIGEFVNQTWDLNETNVFLNAWKIGTRCFVLCHHRVYEGFDVRLLELVSGKGLTLVGLGFAAGC